MLLRDYVRQWLTLRRPLIRASTWRNYDVLARCHLGPLAAMELDAITRGDVKALALSWLPACQQSTARVRFSILYAVLASAVDDELLTRNPAAGVLRVVFGRRKSRSCRAKAFTNHQADAFFAAAPQVTPQLWEYFWTLYQAGMRPGEGLAMRWDHVNLEDRRLVIDQTYSNGRLGPTKNGQSRTIDLSRALVTVLAARRDRRRDEKLPSPWVFPSPLNPDMPWGSWATRIHFDRVLEAAKLPRHFRPHALRHSWTTLLLERRVPLAYLSRALGHASISITHDLYARDAKLSRPQYVDALTNGERRTTIAETRVRHRVAKRLA